MNSQEIDTLFTNVKNYNGCIAKENLKQIKEGCTVLNLSEKGTHWTALYKRNNNTYYFDSFGCMPPLVVFKLEPHTQWSKVQYQKIRASNCGAFASYFLTTCNSSSINTILGFMNKPSPLFVNKIDTFLIDWLLSVQ